MRDTRLRLSENRSHHHHPKVEKRVDFYLLITPVAGEKALRKPWLPDFVCHIGFGTRSKCVLAGRTSDAAVGNQPPGAYPQLSMWRALQVRDTVGQRVKRKLCGLRVAGIHAWNEHQAHTPGADTRQSNRAAHSRPPSLASAERDHIMQCAPCSGALTSTTAVSCAPTANMSWHIVNVN